MVQTWCNWKYSVCVKGNKGAVTIFKSKGVKLHLSIKAERIKILIFHFTVLICEVKTAIFMTENNRNTVAFLMETFINLLNREM